MGSSNQNLVSEHGKAEPNEPDSLTRRLREHGPSVRRAIAPKIPRRWQAVLTADDVMQQTYTDAFVKYDQLVSQAEGVFHVWLSTIANHNLIDALRMIEAEKRGKQRRQIAPKSRDGSMLALHEILAATSATPSRVVARDEACAALHTAIEQLPGAYRTVVEMYDLKRQPVEEVAEALHRTPGAVFMIRARAHRRLQRIMGSATKYITTT